MRQDQQAEWNHPEAKHRQETKTPQKHQPGADRNAQWLGLRQMELPPQDVNPAAWMEAVIDRLVSHADVASGSVVGILPRVGDTQQRLSRAYDAIWSKLREGRKIAPGKSTFLLFANAKGML